MPTIKELYREPTQVEHRYTSQVHQYYSLELFEGSLFVHKQSLQTHVGINANAFAEVLLATEIELHRGNQHAWIYPGSY